MSGLLNRIRDWIDAREWRPIAVSIAVVETPLLIAMWILCVVVNAPWWVMPTALAADAVVIGWIILAVAALTRWLQ